MEPSRLTPDHVVYWQRGLVKLNATIVFTWVAMAVLAVGSWLITRRLKTGTRISRWQNLLEIVVDFMRRQIRDISRQQPNLYLPFVGTLFLFIAVSNVLGIVPYYLPPTASLSTTTALAVCVLLAVPVFGIAKEGVGGYLKHYVTPSPFMLPFHIIGELSRTVALAFRLFGNILSGVKAVGILTALVPFFFPAVMGLLGLLIGVIQAYIFAVLAIVYIASGMEAHERPEDKLAAAGSRADEDRPAQERGSQGETRSAS